jgi:hypothetical protein
MRQELEQCRPEPPRLVLRRRAVADGDSDQEIRRLRHRGGWSALQRGAYLVGAAEPDRRARHLLVVRATVAGLRTPAVVSHGSAAALHDLPLWRVPLEQVHVTRRPPGRSADEARLRSHVARMAPDDVMVIGGIAVTSITRTVVDLARVLPFDAALVVADAALASGATSPGALRAGLDAGAGTRGSRRAGRLVAAADGRSESVGESRSRAVFIEGGLPLPDLQVEVRRPDGVLVGRGDFGWRRQRVLGEFDGRVTYGRLLRPGQDAGDAVFAEKRREDALRDEVWGVVRWVWVDLDAPAQLVTRVGRALERGPR